MNKKIIIVSFSSLFISLGCSTQTKKEKLNAGLQDAAALTGALVSGTVPPVVPYLNSSTSNTQHTIAISGVVLCPDNLAYDFSRLQIEIRENSKISGVYEINNDGTFKITTKSLPGEHVITLISKNKNQTLDKKSVSSNSEKDTFQVTLKACH